MELRRSNAATDMTDDANNNGFRASTYYLLARGLAAEISEVAWVDLEQPIPTPGLDRLMREVTDAVERCHTAVDDAYALAGDDLPDTETLLAIEMALIRSAQAYDEVAVLTRRLAQLALGVCELLDIRSHAVDPLRQSATAVIFMYPFEASFVVDDGIVMHSRNGIDLHVELAGVVARMILENQGRLHIYGDSVFAEPSVAHLHLIVSVDDGCVSVTSNLGHDSLFTHPLMAIEIAHHVVGHLVDHLGNGGTDLHGVRVSLI